MFPSISGRRGLRSSVSYLGCRVSGQHRLRGVSDLGAAEDLGAEDDVAGLVHPVHVPEGGRDREHRVRHRRERLVQGPVFTPKINESQAFK